MSWLARNKNIPSLSFQLFFRVMLIVPILHEFKSDATHFLGYLFQSPSFEAHAASPRFISHPAAAHRQP